MFRDQKPINTFKNLRLLSHFFLHFPQCSLVVTTDVSNLSSNRLRSIQKHHTPVVGVDYVYRCVERGVLLQVDEYKLDTSSALSAPLHRSSFKAAPLASLAPQQIGLCRKHH